MVATSKLPALGFALQAGAPDLWPKNHILKIKVKMF